MMSAKSFPVLYNLLFIHNISVVERQRVNRTVKGYNKIQEHVRSAVKEICYIY